MSEALGKLREYETVFVVNPELTEDATKKEVTDRLKGVLEKMNAELLREDDWGKKKTAFEVKKNPRGHFRLFHYVSEPNAVEELERTMRNMEHVVRYMTTINGDVQDVEAKKAEVDRMVKERADKARAEAEAAAAAAAAAESDETATED